MAQKTNGEYQDRDEFSDLRVWRMRESCLTEHQAHSADLAKFLRHASIRTKIKTAGLLLNIQLKDKQMR